MMIEDVKLSQTIKKQYVLYMRSTTIGLANITGERVNNFLNKCVTNYLPSPLVFC